MKIMNTMIMIMKTLLGADGITAYVYNFTYFVWLPNVDIAQKPCNTEKSCAYLLIQAKLLFP
jgi:hypothetical protein